MRVILGLLVLAVVAVVGLLAWLYSGTYDISVRANAGPVLDWLADTAKRQSVRSHAQHIDVPPLADVVLVEDGARHYQRSCVQCHGAPGVDALPFARAMRPEPSDLAKNPGDWTPGQLFWIIQNGLRMTGMPAYQASYVDGEIWALVAFLDQLPKMEAARYQSLTAPPAVAPLPEAAPGESEEVIPPAEGEEPAQPVPAPSPEATTPR